MQIPVVFLRGFFYSLIPLSLNKNVHLTAYLVLN